MKLNPQQERLQRLGEQLRKLSFPTSPITIELAKWMASGIDEYLRGHISMSKDGGNATLTRKVPLSLDAILKLSVQRRGAPGDPAKRAKIAREVYALSKNGVSWKRIATVIGAKYPGYSERVTIKRVYLEYRWQLLAEEIDATWDDVEPHGGGRK